MPEDTLRLLAASEIPPLRQGPALMAASLLDSPQYGLSLVRSGISPSVVFPTLKSWKTKGLITVCPAPPGMDATDERAIWYRPTRKGRAVLNKALERWKARHRVDQILPIPGTSHVLQN